MALTDHAWANEFSLHFHRKPIEEILEWEKRLTEPGRFQIVNLTSSELRTATENLAADWNPDKRHPKLIELYRNVLKLRQLKAMTASRIKKLSCRFCNSSGWIVLPVRYDDYPFGPPTISFFPPIHELAYPCVCVNDQMSKIWDALTRRMQRIFSNHAETTDPEWYNLVALSRPFAMKEKR